MKAARIQSHLNVKWFVLFLKTALTFLQTEDHWTWTFRQQNGLSHTSYVDGPANLHMETELFIKAGKKKGQTLVISMLSGAVITIKHILTSVFRSQQLNSQHGDADVLKMM